MLPASTFRRSCASKRIAVDTPTRIRQRRESSPDGKLRATLLALAKLDHVGCVLTDQVKQLFRFHQLVADPVDQKMLIERVEVEEEDQAHQSSDSLRQHIY